MAGASEDMRPSTLFSDLRQELPVCARHRDVSHLDCVECMYLSTKIYAPLEEIERLFEARIQEVADLKKRLGYPEFAR